MDFCESGSADSLSAGEEVCRVRKRVQCGVVEYEREQVESKKSKFQNCGRVFEDFSLVLINPNGLIRSFMALQNEYASKVLDVCSEKVVKKIVESKKCNFQICCRVFESFSQNYCNQSKRSHVIFYSLNE